MATLYVSWLKGAIFGVADGPLKSETVATSGSNAASGAAPEAAEIVSLRSDAAHYVKLGAAATTANGIYVAANETRELRVPAGRSITVNAITV